MEHIKATAHGAAARERRAKSPADPDRGPADANPLAVYRWPLLTNITTLRRDLGLTSNDIAVFRALLSFLPLRDKAGSELPVAPDTLTIVFASNREIARRANNLDERVLRHAFTRLAKAGLMVRRDSANAKRFPVKRQGQIVDAYGLDLTPAFEASWEFDAKARALEARNERMRNMTTEARALRQEIIARRLSLGAVTLEWLDELGRVLRRKLPLDMIESIIDTLRNLLAGEPVAAPAPPPAPAEDQAADAVKAPQIRQHADAPDRGPANAPNLEAREMPATNGRIYRHKESDHIDKKTSSAQSENFDAIWRNTLEVQSFYPDPPRTEAEFKSNIFSFSKMMNLPAPTVAHAIGRIGWVPCLKALDYLASVAMKVRSPEAYFRSMIDDAASGKTVGWLRSEGRPGHG